MEEGDREGRGGQSGHRRPQVYQFNYCQVLPSLKKVALP